MPAASPDSPLDWPQFDEPELLERLALSDHEFERFVLRFVGALGRRQFTRELYERALAYPWARPARSYVLRDGAVELLGEMEPPAREELVAAFARAGERHPVLAFGSNGAPEWLTAKLAHFPDAADRTVLVLAGHLHGFDVGVAARPSGYGAMPATIFRSPGTAVRAAVLWVTKTQLTQLTWSELSYRFGRLDGVRFEMDETDVEVHALFAYASRFGTFCIDGAPVALAAIPARGRTATAMTEEQLLDEVARVVIGDGAHAEDLVRAIFDDMGRLAPHARSVLPRFSRPFESEHWTPFPASRARAR